MHSPLIFEILLKFLIALRVDYTSDKEKYREVEKMTWEGMNKKVKK